MIKPSGVSYDDLTPENMILCDLDGNAVPGTPGSERSPSSDTAAHAYVYRNMPDIGGVVHTHSTYAVAWAARGEEIPCVITGMADEFGGPIPIGPFAVIGDDSIGRGIVETLRGHRSRAVLMQNHGPFTIGVTAKDAVKAAVMCEDAARTVHIARGGGTADPDPAGGDRLPLQPLPERLRTDRTDDRRDAAGCADERRGDRAGRTALGIELGSTRIKACLIDAETAAVLAVGSHEWENRFEGRVWTYSLDDVWSGVQAAYAELVADVERRHGVTLETVGAIGVSAMMHGYLAFDADGELLVPFRTWRNTTTGAAAAELSELFGTNIPLRWSVAHLHQAILDDEPHVPEVRFLTTLAGYVHWRLTGRKVLGVGDASGMFPIDPATQRLRRASCSRRFDGLVADQAPAARPRGAAARGARRRAARRPAHRRRRGAARPDRTPAARHPAVPARGRRRHRHGRDQRRRSAHGQRQRGTSIFAMVVLERPLQRRAPRARPRDHPRGRPRRDGALQQRRERAGRMGRRVRPLRRRRGGDRRPRRRLRDRCSARPSRARRTPAGCSRTTTSPASRSPASTRAARCSCAPPTAASRSRTSCAPSSTACSAR